MIVSYVQSCLGIFWERIHSGLVALFLLQGFLGYVLNTHLAARDVSGRCQNRRPVLKDREWHPLALAISH